MRSGSPHPAWAFVERGAGQTLVLVPGIQGRWEWMRPAVDALACRFRAVTFSLPGEPGSGRSPQAFDTYLAHLDAALAFAGCERAIVCGVSYGGLIAVRYAAKRPERVDRLVLVSTPSPSWQPDARVRGYAAAPRSSALAFVAGAPRRLAREIAAAIPNRRQRLATTVGYLGSVVLNPGSARRMAARVRMLTGCDFAADARLVRAPTLVITGEPALDRVVPVEGTHEYLRLIRDSVGVTLERTGHIGLVTRPDAFTDTVWRWTQAGVSRQ
jgi:pimeloyl-ACP methyl ester carboxylesterase